MAAHCQLPTRARQFVITLLLCNHRIRSVAAAAGPIVMPSLPIEMWLVVLVHLRPVQMLNTNP